MSFNGSGTFLINSTGQPVVANTVISATVFNALTADLASGLTNCITKDGQSTPTANIPMGSNKITGLANGTLTSDAATLGQVQTTAAKLIGSISGVDTITGVMSPTLPAYAAGQLFYFVAGGANTGAVTLNIDSLGAKAVTRDGSTALAAGDINSGEMVVVIYDGTRFQMINAANSFGNTTINGTLTVTGKSNLAEVSSPSINASVAVINALTATGASIASANAATAVVTNLTATNASVASVNAGVALLTTATVTSLTATGASIASANIGNLQFTAASIASINAGVAVVTNLTATGASIASANVGTAVITTGTVTSLTATSASVASANAGTAVITNGTVTNLTSTSASIASANAAVALITTGTVTNLTSTAASVASANIGTAVITGLTATGASIASANAGNLQVTGASVASANLGTAVITTGTVTNLTSTSASVASANLGVALVTTGTVTNLTSTAASIASANIGVAAIGSLSFTGASIASLNAGVAVINNLTATSASIASMNGSVASITTVNATNVEVTNVKAKDGTAAITISDSSGNVGIGTTSPSSYGRLGVMTPTATYGYFGIADSVGGAGGLQEAHYYGTAKISYYDTTLTNGTPGSETAYIRFGTANNGTVAERMRIDSSGNVGIGTASPQRVLSVVSSSADSQVTVGNTAPSMSLTNDASNPNGASKTFVMALATTAGNYGLNDGEFLLGGVGNSRGNIVINANYSGTGTKDVVLQPSSGNVGIGGTANAYEKVQLGGTLPTSSNISVGLVNRGTVPSASTTAVYGIANGVYTAAASFTLSSYYQFYAHDVTKGAGSAISNNYGFYCDALTFGTNNFGFFSNIAAGSNRWNFYAAGSASNYMAGSLGVGATPSASAKLTIGGNIYVSGGASSIQYYDTELIFSQAGTGERLRISSGGEVIVGVTDQGAYNLQCNGTGVWGAGAYVNGSDARLKDNIQSLDSGLDVVKAMRPVTFQYKPDYSKDQNVQPGFIAQELQAAMAGKPYLEGVVQEGTNHLNVAYQSIIPILVKAIQELSAKVAALEAK